MLRFFKVNDPYRLVGVLFLLVLIRMFFFWFGVPTIIPEIKWLTIAEKLAEGDIMYQDIWDNTPPLATWVYQWLFILFGKNTASFRVFSIILVIYQAAIFNNMLLKNKAYNQNTYVPALIYMLFMNISFDFFTLPPVLLSMTFVLLATNNLFKRMDNQTRDELFVQIGIYMGLATMFFLPSVLYFLVTIISLLVYTGSIFRRMLLMIYGYSMVVLLTGVYYYWKDSLGLFWFQFLESPFRLAPTGFITLLEILILAAIPFLIFIVSFFRMNKNGRFINFQVKIQRVMLFFFLSGIPAMLMVKDFTTFQLIYFVPALAFFVTHYILTIRNWLKGEMTLLFITILVLANNLFPLKNYLHIDSFVNYQELIVQENEFDVLTRGKKILVIGSNLGLYSGSKLSTPYLNWQYAKYHLENPNYYDNLTSVYRNFTEDTPEIIIDEMSLMPALFNRIPTIQSKYVKKSANVYVLKP